MWWKILFLPAPLYVLSTLDVSSLRITNNFTCYNSSDLAALNASQLFDHCIDDGELWKREDEQNPLPSCSDIFDLLSNHTCVVCRDKQVFAVCQNLSEHAEPRLEGSSGHIEISRCACDQLAINVQIQTPAPLTSTTVSTTTRNDLLWLVLTAVVVVVVVVVIIIPIAAFFIYRNQRRNRRLEDQQDPGVAVQLMVMMPAEEES